MQKRKIILLFIDALRFDFIDPHRTPFLSMLAHKGFFARVIPPFGFEPDGAIFFGLEPEEYLGGMHFKFSKNENLNFDKIAWMDKLPGQRYIRKLLQYWIRWRAEEMRIKKSGTIAAIPLELLKYFDFVEKKMPLESEEIAGNINILTQLYKKYRFEYWGFPYNKVRLDQPAKYLNLFKNQRLESVLIYLHQLDGIAHRFGPESNEAAATLMKIDDFLRTFISPFLDEDVSIAIFGDHGMATVKATYDFPTMLKQLPLRLHQDYIYFLDSVFARFWVLNSRAEKVILDFLENLPSGRIITDKDKVHYHINFKDNRFGDIIFWANDGVEFFPNFWNKSQPNKGMHGYRESCKENHTAFLLYDSNHKHSTDRKEHIKAKEIYFHLQNVL